MDPFDKTQGRIIFEGTTEKGLPVVIRYITLDDAGRMQKYFNTISAEQTFIAFQGKTLSLEEEIKYLKPLIEKIQNNKAVGCLAFSGNELIAAAQLVMNFKEALNHEADFGISVAKEYRGKGAGKILMQAVLEQALKNIPELRIVTLGVFATNDIAMNMYKKFGFVEFGRLPEGVLHRGNYIDHIYMYKRVRD